MEHECDIFGCLNKSRTEQTITVVLDDISRTWEVCEYHYNLLLTMSPELYEIGITYRGEPEIRLRPAIPASPEE